MTRFWQKHKISLVIFALAAGLQVISGPLFRGPGKRLIAAAYRGESLPLINRMIADRDGRTLEEYLGHGGRLLARFQGYIYSLMFFLAVYLLFALLLRLRRQTIQGAGLLFLTIVLIIGSTEISLRYLKPVELGKISFANFQPSANPDIQIEPRPLSGGYNPAGFRGPEYPKKKTKGVYRIVIIGDSLAYGLHVEEEETYARQLERLLNRTAEENRRYEVLNLGVPGYRTVQIVARLQEKGLAYDPDLIIYGYWLDDISYSGLLPFYFDPVNLNLSEEINRRMAGGELERAIKARILDSQIVRRILLLLREISRRRERGGATRAEIFPVAEGMKELQPEMREIWEDYRARILQGEYRDPPGSEPYYTRYADPGDFALWSHWLGEFSRIGREKDIPTLLLLTPVLWDYEIGPYPWAGLHRFLHQAAVASAIPYLDLRETFQGYPARRLRTVDLEHPGPLGHQLIADELYRWIKEQGN